MGKTTNSLKDFNYNEALMGLVLFSLPVSLKLNSICQGLFVAYNLFLRIRHKTFFGISFFASALFIFGLQILSFYLSENQDEASKKLILFLSFIMFSFLLPKAEIRIDKVFRYLLCGTLIVMVYALLMSFYEVVFNGVRFDYGRGPDLLLKYTPHHAYLSLFILVSILVLAFQIGSNRVKSANIILIPFLFLFLFVLPSRTALLISFIVIPMFTFYFFKKKYGKKQLVSLYLILFLIALVGLSFDFARDKLVYAYYEFLNIPTEEKPFYGIGTREKIWASSMTLIREAPFFGYGIGDVQDILNREYIRKGYSSLLNLNAHSQYLQWILQYGFLLALSFVIIIVHIVRRLILIKETLLLSIWLITLLFFTTESMLNRQWGVVFFAVLLSLSIYKIYYMDFTFFFKSNDNRLRR